MMRTQILLWVLVLGLSACEQGELASSPVIELDNAAMTASFDGQVDATTLDAGAAIVTVASDGGAVLVGTADGVFTWNGTELTVMDVYAEDPAGPWVTGAVTAMATRPQGGAFVAAESGLFTTAYGVLVPSPVNASLQDVVIGGLAVRGQGEAEELWIAADSGLVRVTAGLRSDFDLPDGGRPLMVAASDAALLVATDQDGLYVIDPVGMAVSRLDGAAPVSALAGAPSQLWALTGEGVIGQATDGAWTVFAGDPAAGEPRGLAVDDAQGAFLVTDMGVLELTAGGSAATIGDTVTWPQGLQVTVAAVDGSGHLVAAGFDATAVAPVVGAPLSFEVDIAPIFERLCNSCHISGASGVPLRDFTDYAQVVAIADPILERIGTGLMPPAEMPQLNDDEYDAVVSWFATGATP